ncbi:MAG: UdgX family uracil-DNA binding protein [Myxococcaceae bacterium]|nr:UdgX family uracil-DNA binding protein [Myxococcaceae bacterium]
MKAVAPPPSQVPGGKQTLLSLKSAAQQCRACPLWERGTQTVFGEGQATARLVLVGEQPGNDEDLVGRPFVGPSGQLLDRALAEAGIERTDAYVTNVVKHFKWTGRGKRRLHSKPNVHEVNACFPWLEAELAALQPHVLFCLGATAAQAILGRDFRVTQSHGQLFPSSRFAPWVGATVHPSSVLRTEGDDERAQAMATFVDDLRQVARALTSAPEIHA